jgi:hypothetical protein
VECSVRGIYFADTIEICRQKAGNKPAVITAMVALGRSAVLNKACNHLTKQKMGEWNFDSVTGRSSEGASWEWVIFWPELIDIISVTINGQEIWTPY